MRRKLVILGTILPTVLVLDLWTKSWALRTLPGLPGRRLELFDGLVPLTLAFNLGAAFGIGVGEDSRWFFVPVTFLALGLLALLYRQADERDHLRTVSLALVIAGALGNLWDRIRWDRGVVDFIGPLDLIVYDFPIFNVADMAISCGAVALAISFWQEERAERRQAREDAEDAGVGTNVA